MKISIIKNSLMVFLLAAFLCNLSVAQSLTEKKRQEYNAVKTLIESRINKNTHKPLNLGIKKPDNFLPSDEKFSLRKTKEVDRRKSFLYEWE